MGEYRIIAKTRSEFQKLLNQWKHNYNLILHYVHYYPEIDSFIAIIERKGKCPHGTFGGRNHCIKCMEENDK